MSLSVRVRSPREDQFNSGLAFAVMLHIAVAAALIATAYAHFSNHEKWGSDAATAGAIQASMVSALPLPPKAAPVEKSVLASEDVTPAPKPPPKEATQPPPKPTDIPIKATTPPKTVKTAPIATPVPPKHAQPTPETPKAASGDAATQLPQSVTQLKNGTASITVQDRAFGDRYAYYIAIVGRITNQSWGEEAIDPRTAQHKSVTIRFDINRDGMPTNIKIAASSGITALDTAAVRAIQRIEGYGPLPPGGGDHKAIEYKFNYN